MSINNPEDPKPVSRPLVYQRRGPAFDIKFAKRETGPNAASSQGNVEAESPAGIADNQEIQDLARDRFLSSLTQSGLSEAAVEQAGTLFNEAMNDSETLKCSVTDRLKNASFFAKAGVLREMGQNDPATESVRTAFSDAEYDMTRAIRDAQRDQSPQGR